MEEESLCFYDPNFITQQPLSVQNIIDYFSTSQFYDKSCLNEILKMQSQFANINLFDKITQTIGFYYILEFSSENLFVIAKKENDGQKTSILKMYYCISGYIYCAPTAKMISDSKTIDSLLSINSAIDKYVKRRSFNWLRGLEFKKDEKANEANQNEIKFIFETLHEFEAKANKNI